MDKGSCVNTEGVAGNIDTNLYEHTGVVSASMGRMMFIRCVDGKLREDV